MPIFNICRFMMRVTVWNSETQGWSTTLVKILALSPCLPLPRGSPMGLQNPGLHVTSAGTRTGACPEDPPVYIPHWEEHKIHHLITTDNLIHSAKPTAFLILLGNKILVETTYFHIPPKCICRYDGFLTKPYTPSPSQFTSGPGPAGWSL